MAGGNVTSADLTQAMMESFRIGGTADSDKSDSNDDNVILTATECKFSCNLCGKQRNKAKDCSQCDKIKLQTLWLIGTQESVMLETRGK